ncbi:MAG: M1 family metallopeptidase [Saprospiraceae bacterium]|nr:M1 family metallopeptidase [Saprospiraceae bacterium]
MRFLRAVLMLSFYVLIMSALPAQRIVSGGPLKPTQSVYDVLHYRILLDVDIEKRIIRGITEIKLNMLVPSKNISFDLLQSYKVTEVWMNNKKQTFTHENHNISITTPANIPTGTQTIKIEYSGVPPLATNPPWVGGIQWEKDDNGKDWVAFTCQNEGAKTLYPCKDHPSDKPDQGAEMEVLVPQGLKVAGPGLLVKEYKKDKKQAFVWKAFYPIHNYSLVFNIGDYEVVQREYTTIDGNKVPMVFYVLRENKPRAQKHLDILEKSLRVLEKYFGEYPFVKEKIGIAETPHLGMEHQTMNAYGNRYRYSQVGGEDFDWLMHHELGHEWWGNKVSNRDWAHFWIQEGICNFGDWLYYLEKEGKASFHQQAINASYQFLNKYPIVQDSVVDSGKAYHPDIYGKGAFFMRSLSFIIGDSLFFRILKDFISDKKHTYQNTVSTSDVERFFSAGAGMQLQPYFDFFLKSTDKLRFRVKAVRPGEYDVKFLNYFESLPVEIQTSGGIMRTEISDDATRIYSDSLPIIDPGNFYLKSVLYE